MPTGLSDVPASLYFVTVYGHRQAKSNGRPFLIQFPIRLALVMQIKALFLKCHEIITVNLTDKTDLPAVCVGHRAAMTCFATLSQFFL